jgi:hypothetical protein
VAADRTGAAASRRRWDPTLSRRCAARGTSTKAQPRRPVTDGCLSVSAFATRALTAIARRADNPALLGDLPDVGVEAADIAADVEAGRSAR